MKFLQDLLHIAADTLPLWRDLGIMACCGVLIAALLILAGIWHGTN